MELCVFPKSSSIEQKAQAVTRLKQGENADTIARELGVSRTELLRWEKLFDKACHPSPTELGRHIAAMATSFGYASEPGFCFSFPEVGGTKRYCPDGVWFDGSTEEKNAVAIFEIDDSTSPKHRAGGAALANAVALKYEKRLYFFAVAPPEHAHVATTSVGVLQRFLGDKWQLMTAVVPTFEPDQIRRRVAEVLGKAS